MMYNYIGSKESTLSEDVCKIRCLRERDASSDKASRWKKNCTYDTDKGPSAIFIGKVGGGRFFT